MGVRKKLRTRCSPKLSPWKILIFIVILKVGVMSLLTWKLLKVGNDEPLIKNTTTTRLQPNIQNATQAPEEDESAGRILDSETIRIQQGQSCIFPTMTPWDSMLRSMYDKNKPSPFPCLKLERNWVETDMGKLKIIVPGAKCNYTPIARIHENRADRVVNSTMDVSDGDMLVSDFFDIFCAKDNGTYNNTHAAIAYNQSVIDRSIRLQKNSTQTDFFSGFNVLIFAFDSVARLAWIRALPKSHAYFVETLGGFVFEGHTVVGDGTTPQLLAMLTGQTEEELPESRVGYKGSRPVDNFPWIWNDFKNVGYVTQYGEDMALANAFNYRLKGFEKQPVDHYLRPFMQATLQYRKDYCYRGSVPEYKVLLTWMEEFIHMYKNRPKFSLVFDGELTHGSAFQLPAVDDEVFAFLERLNAGGVLENTMLVSMSDHGARFSGLRKTERGRLEERNPYFGIRLPTSFLDKHKNIRNNLKTNIHRLTSPFDLYETLRELIHFTGSEKGNVSHRGISLFKEIPKERTCADAGILSHWCTCLNSVKLDIGDALVQRAGKAAVIFVNNMTANEREHCVELSLKSIERAIRFGQNENVLKFKGSLDVHGRKPDLSDNKRSSKNLYLIQLVTSPNDGVYEITVDHNVVKDKFVFDSKSVSRVNKYAMQPHCVMDRLPHLRQFCYCKVQLNNN